MCWGWAAAAATWLLRFYKCVNVLNNRFKIEYDIRSLRHGLFSSGISTRLCRISPAILSHPTLTWNKGLTLIKELRLQVILILLDVPLWEDSIVAWGSSSMSCHSRSSIRRVYSFKNCFVLKKSCVKYAVNKCKMFTNLNWLRSYPGLSTPDKSNPSSRLVLSM